MSPTQPDALDVLAAARATVNELVRRQHASVIHFWDEDDGVFFRSEGDRQTVAAESDQGKARQPRDPNKVKSLTTSITCLESLLETPGWMTPASADLQARDRLRQLMRQALEADTQSWASDGAAWVYCRVRTLGSALRLETAPDFWTGTRREEATRLISQAWRSRHDPGGSFGLREATEDPAGEHVVLDLSPSEKQYPANAFLTYWGLLALDGLRALPVSPDGQPAGNGADAPEDEGQRLAALDWLRKNLATQVTFHFARSRHADAQQLGWSLCGLVRFADGSALSQRTSAEGELLAAGVRALFEQLRDGEWPLGAPLFHYPKAGNAYCYQYETLAELLSLVSSDCVQPQAADALADALRPHLDGLLALLSHAQTTAQRLDPEVLAWSSGHHAHRDTPESWATASVYRFAQSLRRVLGSWSSSESKQALAARRPRDGGLETLLERGGTWDVGNGSAGAFLSTAFVHPVLQRERERVRQDRFRPDPDERLLGEHQARSAMLFGPPGTGKTTLVEGVAAALGWDFVEVTPAQFLDGGVDQVSSRADEIFRRIMDLDRCVVLLDEIDELIRGRTAEPDSLSRFFTTTMLPRLAKLWDNARVLFFVNTNDILRVDVAIRRSQRFDAALLVLPPGYEMKRAILNRAGLDLQVEESAITTALTDEVATSAADRPLGWFALVRYDQMATLADRLRAGPTAVVDKAALIVGLETLTRELGQLDWYRPEPNRSGGAKPKAEPSDVPDVTSLINADRRDSRVWLVSRVRPGAYVPPCVKPLGDDEGPWVQMGAQLSPEKWAEERSGTLAPDGYITFREEAEG